MSNILSKHFISLNLSLQSQATRDAAVQRGQGASGDLDDAGGGGSFIALIMQGIGQWSIWSCHGFVLGNGDCNGAVLSMANIQKYDPSFELCCSIHSMVR